MEEQKLKRISLMVEENQYLHLIEKNINISGLIRDLINDYLGNNKITLTVSAETKEIYNQIISQTTDGDQELEPYVKKALHGLLKEKIRLLEQLEKKNFGKN